MSFVAETNHNNYESAGFEAHYTNRRDFDTLTKEQEKEAFERLAAGDDDALEDIVKANQRFVVKSAYTFFMAPLPMEDLIQAGNVGLLAAARKFDPKYGVRFITMARWWIRQSLQAAALDDGYTVNLPKRNWVAIKHILRARSEYYTETGREPTVEELMEITGNDENLVHAAIVANTKNVEMDRDVDWKGDQVDWKDRLPGLAAQPRQEDRVNHQEVKGLIGDALAMLSSREAEIIKRRFGLGFKAPEGLEEIGKDMGISRERVRQIESAAIKAIRTLHKFKRFRESCGMEVE